MKEYILSARDKAEIFAHQQDNGIFSALAVETAGLNYLDRLNRKRLDRTVSPAARTTALHETVALEQKLYQYVQDQTPLSYFDIDFRKQTQEYIRMRLIFLKAVSFTFKRHRLQFLLELLQLYTEDPCNILPEKHVMIKKLEHILLYDYLLLDMGRKNTEDIGREAVSNGYHECDYTLEIEEVWKQPMQAVPRTNFRYVVTSLPYSNAAAAIVSYMKNHLQDMVPSLWVVDAAEIWTQCLQHKLTVTATDIAAIQETYIL
ncbi:MAG: hypothetical protein LKF74_05345 [Megasphaera sp.]|jgi:hypothetical protein|nr:hypothetical protein [Megasphaera sp.]MCH4188128.1 hypothetical protein [Megasphaera sp.]MCH4217966.1 hypothetical protein [Megasphaera sp.]